MVVSMRMKKSVRRSSLRFSEALLFKQISLPNEAYGPSGEATSVAGQAGAVRMGERVAYGRPAILAAKEKAKGTKGKGC